MNNNIKAALLIMLAMTFISCNDAIMKTLTVSLGVGQVIFIRGCFACLFFMIVLKATGKPLFPKLAFSHANLARGLCEMCAALSFITALSLLPIGIVSTLTWTSPIVATLLAALVLKETVIMPRWLAVFIGFIGITLVTNPFGSQFSITLILPLIAACFVAIRDIFTRKIPTELSSIHITLATVILVTIAGFVLSLFNWQPVSLPQVFKMAGAAVLLSCGFFSQVTAMRKGELSFIAPFSYFGIIVALILGIVFWNEIPTAVMLIGVLLIIISGILITLSQRPRRLRFSRAG